jgi:hypothetical protein
MGPGEDRERTAGQVHDRDSIYAQALDTSIANLRLRVLKTPYRSRKQIRFVSD